MLSFHNAALPGQHKVLIFSNWCLEFVPLNHSLSFIFSKGRDTDPLLNSAKYIKIRWNPHSRAVLISECTAHCVYFDFEPRQINERYRPGMPELLRLMRLDLFKTLPSVC